MYKYGMKHRSVSPGAQPKGIVDWTEDTDKYFAVISYDRKLTKKELEDYELEEVNMPSSESHKRSVAKYNAKNYETQTVFLKLGSKALIKAAAEAVGESVNAFCTNAILERVQAVNGELTER